MTTGKLKLFDVTPANNGTAANGAGVNWAEGQARATVNNSARAWMSIQKGYLLDNEGLTTAGTSTAYTCTTNQGMGTPEDGDTLVVKLHTACGATPTLAPDGGTARTIVHSDGSAIAANDLTATRYLLRYDLSGTKWYVVDGLKTTTSNTANDARYAKLTASQTLTGVQTVTVDDASNNTVTRPLVVQHTTSGTAGTGIGTGISFKLEDGAGNTDEVMRVDYVSTDVTNGSEDGDYVVTAMVAGSLTEIFRVSNAGLIKRTAGYSVAGTNTNDSAAAGYVGEFISSTVLGASAVALTTGTDANITTLSLTAGDWDVWGTALTNPAGGTTTTTVIGWISTTSATLPTFPNNGALYFSNASIGAGLGQGGSVGTTRLSLSGTTTVYLSMRVTFAVSTMGGYGYIAARRVR